MKMAVIDTLTLEFQRLTGEGFLPAHDALKLFTSNPATRLGLMGEKGVIAPSACADILVFEDSWQIDSVISKGEIYI